ncbi:MAG: ABC transporter permease [Blastocatellia bacterium]
MQTLIQDLRYGARMLMKKPGFTLIAIFTLALGIGANTAIFTVINAALFKPLPYADESRLVVLREFRTDDWQASKGVSYLNFADWRAQSHSFETMALATMDTATFRGDAEPLRVEGAIVSADFFKTLGIAPQLGRAFEPNDEQVGTSEGLNSLMLTHSGWQKHFGGDGKIIGRRVLIDERPFQIVGVAPPNIFPLAKEPVDFLATIAVNGNPTDKDSVNGSRNYRAYPGVIARLKPGVTTQQAESELASIQSGLAQQYPKVMAKRAVSVEPLRELFVRDARGVLWLLLGMVGVILLIACVNVANLALARAATRQREIAIRIALGANRRDIIQQFMVESLLLAFIGGILGLTLSLWLVEGLTALLPADVPQLSGLTPDWRVLLFTLGAASLTGLLCGLVPAFTAGRGNVGDAIKSGGDGGRSATGNILRERLRNTLVIGEVALGLTLLIGAGLLLNSLARLNEVKPGFEFGNTLTMQMTLGGARYRGEMEKPEKLNTFLAELTARVKALPGVNSVAYAQCVPLTGQENNTAFQIVGDAASGEKPSAQLRFVSADYFQTLNIPLVNGRAFTERDNPQSPSVALVNEAFVREHFNGANPIGKKLKMGWGGEAPKEIVGVVSNVRHRSLSDAVRAEMYVPQSQFANAGITLIARTMVAPESLVNAVKEQVRALDPELPMTAIKTLAAYRQEALALPRFNAFLLTVFALLALMLTLVGLYGVMSYSVTQRTQEIGIRMALGAQAGDVLRMIVGKGMKLVAIGVLFGLVGALALTRLLRNWLYGVTATDPLTFVVIALLLIGVALVACWIPARRATQVDPMIALRCD